MVFHEGKVSIRRHERKHLGLGETGEAGVRLGLALVRAVRIGTAYRMQGWKAGSEMTFGFVKVRERSGVPGYAYEYQEHA